MKRALSTALARAVFAVYLNPPIRRATSYESPQETITVTKQRKTRRNERSVTMLVTIGTPNFRSRRFIAQCARAGEPFPVRKLQLHYWPKKQPTKRRTR